MSLVSIKPIGAIMQHVPTARQKTWRHQGGGASSGQTAQQQGKATILHSTSHVVMLHILQLGIELPD